VPSLSEAPASPLLDLRALRRRLSSFSLALLAAAGEAKTRAGRQVSYSGSTRCIALSWSCVASIACEASCSLATSMSCGTLPSASTHQPALQPALPGSAVRRAVHKRNSSYF
jgi:hypothetical protein